MWGEGPGGGTCAHVHVEGDLVARVLLDEVVTGTAGTAHRPDCVLPPLGSGHRHSAVGSACL